MSCHEDIHGAVKVKVHCCECEHTGRVGVDLVFKTSQEIVYGDPTEHTYVCGGARKGSRSTELEDLQIKHQWTYFVHAALVKKFLQLYTVGSLLCSLCSLV